MTEIPSQKEDAAILPEFKLSALFPYFLPFIISLGVFRLMTFYGEFGVRIISFLDFSEVIISFMDILIIFVLVAGVNVINSKLQFSKQDFEKHRRFYEEIQLEKSEWRKFKMVLNKYRPILIFYAITMLALLIFSFFKHVPSYVLIYFGVVACAGLVINIIRVEIDIWHKDFNSSQAHKEFTHVVLNALMYVVIVFATARIEAEIIKDSPDRRKVSITLNDNTALISTPTFYFIGKTANYIFLYSTEDKRTQVIPISRISKLEFYDQ